MSDIDRLWFTQGFYDSACKKVCYGRYAQLAMGEQPPLRTLVDTIANGNKAAEMARAGDVDGQKSAGVKGRSSLLKLSYFDITTDCTLDMMHITSGVVGRHLVKLITGARLKGSVSAAKKAAKAAAARTQEQIDADVAAAHAHEQNAAREEKKETAARERARNAIAAMEKAQATATSRPAKERKQLQINAAEKAENDRQDRVRQATTEAARKHAEVIASRDPPSRVSEANNGLTLSDIV